jgi:phosphate transport system permease protein
VVLGGIIIIAAILAILFVIAAEVYPLFREATAVLVATRPAPAPVMVVVPGRSLGVDEYREVAYEVAENAAIHFVDLRGRRVLPSATFPVPAGARVTVAARGGTPGSLLVGTSDGRVIASRVAFEVTYAESGRTVTPAIEFDAPVMMDAGGKAAVRQLAAADAGGGPVTVAQIGPTELAIQTVVERKALVGAGTTEASLQTLSVPVAGEVTALRLDGRGEDLFLGTSTGQVIRYDVRDPATPTRMETVDASARPGAPITVLGFLIGDRTLVVGDGAGGVSSWQLLAPPAGGAPRLQQIYRFEGHAGAVVAFSASRRDKGFVTADRSGQVRLHYGTSGRTLLTMTSDQGPLRTVVFAPKADGVLAAGEKGPITEWALHNPHPEITLATLFGKVWYEGYAGPDHVWQSTGGTDDFEAKFSLTPLVFGTMKGTFYALIFAIPLALLAAIYVSEFMHPTIKGYVKPVVEIMAALPSVVLGFLAGLWLAPMVERIVPGLFLMPLVVPVCILGALGLWQIVPGVVRGRFRAGAELVLLLPVVVAGAALAFALGGLIEATLLGGSYRGWLLSALGLTYDQRNSLVVGVAMGFAVIPIIFTIAEDSLANVPQHLRAGSLALGATRWQTAVRIVLPTASPGIFSAIMIGFGRAVGETMIVLMATGNTPVMDWSIFNGFRALSANIAVELPEAPEGGTLFRVLFLAAFLLFCFTFVMNTVAEVVRLRLRRKYRYL